MKLKHARTHADALAELEDAIVTKHDNGFRTYRITRRYHSTAVATDKDRGAVHSEDLNYLIDSLLDENSGTKFVSAAITAPKATGQWVHTTYALTFKPAETAAKRPVESLTLF